MRWLIFYLNDSRPSSPEKVGYLQENGNWRTARWRGVSILYHHNSVTLPDRSRLLDALQNFTYNPQLSTKWTRMLIYHSLFLSSKIFGNSGHSNEKSNFCRVSRCNFVCTLLLCQKQLSKRLCGYARLAFLRSKAQDLSRKGNVIRMGKKESGQHLV